MSRAEKRHSPLLTVLAGRDLHCSAEEPHHAGKVTGKLRRLFGCTVKFVTCSNSPSGISRRLRAVRRALMLPIDAAKVLPPWSPLRPPVSSLPTSNMMLSPLVSPCSRIRFQQALDLARSMSIASLGSVNGCCTDMRVQSYPFAYVAISQADLTVSRCLYNHVAAEMLPACKAMQACRVPFW